MSDGDRDPRVPYAGGWNYVADPRIALPPREDIRERVEEGYRAAKELWKWITEELPWAAWGPLAVDERLYEVAFGTKDFWQVWNNMAPIHEEPGVALVIPTITPPAVVPPPEQLAYENIVWNALSKLALRTHVLAFFGRLGCIACPVGHFLVRMRRPGSPVLLAHIARLNVPPGCSPFIVQLRGIMKDWIDVEVIWNLPIPIDIPVRVASQAALAVVQSWVYAYEALAEACSVFNKRFCRSIGVCLSVEFVNVLLAGALISSCLRKCAEQLREGMEQAREVERVADNQSTELIRGLVLI